MRASWYSSSRILVLLEVLVFIPAAFVLLKIPSASPAGESGLHVSDGLCTIVAAVAWLVNMGCLQGIRARQSGQRKRLSYLIASFLTLAFLTFFAIERFAQWLFQEGGLWPPPHAAGMLHPWIQIAASLLITAAAALILPALHTTHEDNAVARMEHDRFLAAAESSLDDFYIFDGVPDERGEIVDFRFSYVNPNALRRLGATHEFLEGKILTEVRPFMISSGLIEKYREVVRTGKPFTAEVYLDDERIRATWLHVQVVKLGNGIAITSRDITDQKRMLDHISYLAHHDQLTGLPNRTLLEDRLQQALLLAERHQHKVAVALIDVDNFKEINDSLGHALGDAVLASFAQRLRNSLRQSDTVARMGGDEFVLVMPEFRQLEDIILYIRHIVEFATAPLVIDNRQIPISVSTGISIYPDSGKDVRELLKHADIAMYSVKRNGGNNLLACWNPALKSDENRLLCDRKPI